MKLALTTFLLFVNHFIYAQTNDTPEAIKTILSNNKSGWMFSNTYKMPYADGPGYYFYFTQDSRLLVFTQKKRNDPNRKLIINTTYSLFQHPDDQIGMIINNFHGDIKRLILESTTTSGPTEFFVIFSRENEEFELRNYPHGMKRYYSNKFYK